MVVGIAAPWLLLDIQKVWREAQRVNAREDARTRLPRLGISRNFDVGLQATVYTR